MYGLRVCLLHVLRQGPVRRVTPVAALAPDGDLETGVARPSEGPAREDRFVEQGEPFLSGAVGRYHTTGSPVAVDHRFAEVDQVLVLELVQTEAVDDREIWHRIVVDGSHLLGG